MIVVPAKSQVIPTAPSLVSVPSSFPPDLEQVRSVRPFNAHPKKLARTDADFQHTAPHFNIDPDAGLEGDERFILDPTQPVEDPQFMVITDANGTRKIQVTPEQREEQIRKSIFKKAFAEQELTYNDLLPWRIKVCYRIVREMGRVRGLVCDNESLDYGLKPRPHNPDPWVIPEKYNRPKDRRPITAGVVDSILAAEELPHDWRIRRRDFSDDTIKEYVGVALFPPAIPDRFLTPEGTIRYEYDPYQDRLLSAYLTIFVKTSDLLSVEVGSKSDPDLGRYGLTGILDAETIRAVFPTKIQILTWEHVLIDQVLDMLIEGSQRWVRRRLFEMYGFFDREIDSLIQLAQARAMQQHCGDKDQNRAIMVMKIQDFIRRSKDGLNFKAEMDGLKQLSIVMGLTAEQEDTILGDLVDLMKRVNEERMVQRRSLDPTMRFVENTAPQGR